jgi:hypothetical protein
MVSTTITLTSTPEQTVEVHRGGSDRCLCRADRVTDYLNEQGLNITARTIKDVQRRECSLLPQATYQQLIQAYSADLLAASVSDTGGSVNIMTIHRGPKIGPETD